LKRQMKQKEEEEILKDKGVLFDPEKTEEEKREALKKLYEDIDKQIQLKNQMKKQKLEEEQQFEKEILEYNNRKKVNQEKIESIKKNGINKRIKESELLGKTLKWNRREQIEKYCEINGNREPLFTDKNIKERNEQFKKHFIENYKYQLKQAEEARQLREKEREEEKQFYNEQGIKAYNELKEEEARSVERKRTKSIELKEFNRQLMEEKEKRKLECQNDTIVKKLDEDERQKDQEFNEYAIKCIKELEMKGRDVRNLYRYLKVDDSNTSNQDYYCLPDTFRRLGVNTTHNVDDDLVSYLQSTKNDS